MSRAKRRTMVIRAHPALSLSRQCRLLSIGRSSLYYTNGTNYCPEIAQSLIPMDMIVSGWSISLFQAWQPASMMAS